uniref:Uncharacterized protein n=1 Tax=Arundo donax TaxID=35708 RepID=A0A0A9AEF1_ARUDO
MHCLAPLFEKLITIVKEIARFKFLSSCNSVQNKL